MYLVSFVWYRLIMCSVWVRLIDRLWWCRAHDQISNALETKGQNVENLEQETLLSEKKMCIVGIALSIAGNSP